MTCNLRSIRTRLGLTQRELAQVFSMTASNVAHYEAGKQEFPPNVARALIKEAACHGLTIGFDDIYGSSDDRPVEPLQEAA